MHMFSFSKYCQIVSQVVDLNNPYSHQEVFEGSSCFIFLPTVGIFHINFNNLFSSISNFKMWNFPQKNVKVLSTREVH